MICRGNSNRLSLTARIMSAEEESSRSELKSVEFGAWHDKTKFKPDPSASTLQAS